MKRRDFLKVSAAGAAATAVASPAIAQSSPEIKWRLTSSFPKSLDTIYGGAEQLAKQVAEMTDNKFQIQVFAAGEIVPGLQALDATSNGTVEMCHTVSYYYVGKDPTFAIFASVPFGLNARQAELLVVSGRRQRARQRVLQEVQRDRLPLRQYRHADGRLVPQGDQDGRRSLGPQDAHRRHRRSGACRRSASCRSRSPAATSIRRSKRAPSTRPSGSVRMTTRSSASTRSQSTTTIRASGKAARRCTPSVNLEKWNSLPKNYQAILTNARANANSWMTARYDMQNPAALKRLVAGGTQLRPFTNEVLEACLKATNELWAEISGKNADFKKSIDAMQAYRSDQYLWWQVAEYTYDSFMIRSRTRG